MKNNAELISALNVISKQRGISVDILTDTLASAHVNTYKKKYNVNRNVRANMKKKTGAKEILFVPVSLLYCFSIIRIEKFKIFI